MLLSRCANQLSADLIQHQPAFCARAMPAALLGDFSLSCMMPASAWMHEIKNEMPFHTGVRKLPFTAAKETSHA